MVFFLVLIISCCHYSANFRLTLCTRAPPPPMARKAKPSNFDLRVADEEPSGRAVIAVWNMLMTPMSPQALEPDGIDRMASLCYFQLKTKSDSLSQRINNKSFTLFGKTDRLEPLRRLNSIAPVCPVESFRGPMKNIGRSEQVVAPIEKQSEEAKNNSVPVSRVLPSCQLSAGHSFLVI